MVLSLAKVCGSFHIDSATTDAMDILNDARSLDITLRTLKASSTLVFYEKDSNSDLKRSGFTVIDSSMKVHTTAI